MAELLDARGVRITPGAGCIVVYGSGDRARPYYGTVMGVNAGARGYVVRKTPSGYPYVQVCRLGVIFERPERMIVAEVPDAS